jgi:hypothetical protein
MPLDRAGFEPRRVIRSMADIADAGSVQKFESIIEPGAGTLS